MDPRNVGLIAARDKYQAHILTSMCTMRGSSSVEFDGAAVNVFLQHAATLYDLMLTSVHIFAGSPARGTEMATALLRNALGRGGVVQKRNVFYMSHLDAIAIVLTYNKVDIIAHFVSTNDIASLRIVSYRFIVSFHHLSLLIMSHQAGVKHIPRYLRGELKRTFIFVEAILRPCVEELLYFVVEKERWASIGMEEYLQLRRNDNDSLWVCRRGLALSSEAIRWRFSKTFSSVFKLSISFAAYRQVNLLAIYICALTATTTDLTCYYVHCLILNYARPCCICVYITVAPGNAFKHRTWCRRPDHNEHPNSENSEYWDVAKRAYYGNEVTQL